MKFTIKQGEHYTNRRWWIWLNRRNRTRRLMYSVVLSANSWYSDKLVAYSGWNKIFGFGAWNHHADSARLVYKPDDLHEGRLLVAAYTYEAGIWTAREFSHTYVESARTMAIEAVHDADPSKTGYSFLCGCDQLFVRHPNPINVKKLWPYFGGHDRAYKDFSVTLKKILQP